MNDFFFSCCCSLATHHHKVHYQLVNYMFHYQIRKTRNLCQCNYHYLLLMMCASCSFDFVKLLEHIFDDDEYSCFDEYHYCSNNNSVLSNVKVDRYNDNDIVDLWEDGWLLSMISVVEYFEFYHKWK